MAQFFSPVRHGLITAVLFAALSGAPALATESDRPMAKAATTATAAPAATTPATVKPAAVKLAATDAQATMPRPAAKRRLLAAGPQPRRVAYRDGCSGFWCGGRLFVLMLGVAF